MARDSARAAVILTLAVALAGCQSSAPPSPIEEVTFQSGGIALSGTLFFPTDRPPHAPAVLIHGSGRVERMSVLARLLVSDGFAVLTYDKRGVGGSGGVYEGRGNASADNLRLLAADAAAALALAAAHPRLENVTAGFVGISQAGGIAPIAATLAPAAAFIALGNGPVCTVSEELHFSALAESDPRFWETHTAADVEAHMRSVSYRADDVDPRTSLRQLSILALWVYGGRDVSSPVDLSVARQPQLIDGGQRRFDYRIFPSYGHETSRFPDPRYDFVVAWIRAVASNARRGRVGSAGDASSAGRRD